MYLELYFIDVSSIKMYNVNNGHFNEIYWFYVHGIKFHWKYKIASCSEYKQENESLHFPLIEGTVLELQNFLLIILIIGA